jgi:hypothetical protein
MPEIVVVSIVFGSLLGALYLILDFFRSRRTGSDHSLTQGELSGLIEDAVDRATDDLRRRIENLEAIAVEESAPNAPRLLEDSGLDEDVIEEEIRQPRRVRS